MFANPFKQPVWRQAAGAVLALLACGVALAQQPAAQPQPQPAPARPAGLSAEPARVAPSMQLSIGKSTLLRVPDPVERVSVANPAVADVTVLGQREIYLLGKDLGATNVIVWGKGGPATVIDVQVTADPALLAAEYRTLLPNETDLQVRMSGDGVILSGSVSDAPTAAHAVAIADAWVQRLLRHVAADGRPAAGAPAGDARSASAPRGARVINMLRVRDPQQVMLEVKVAEVSKALLERLGVSTFVGASSGGTRFSLLSESAFLNQLLNSAAVFRNSKALQLDAQQNNGLINILAEPNIMAISGQEASFRAGGKIFIPVSRESSSGIGSHVTLEEKEFGVGVKFKPTVLAGGRIHLQVSPEVSELIQSGSPFTSVSGATAVLPSFTLRRAETTVQLNDGQSFMIAGLIRNSLSESINRFPGLGDVPVLGALFRSSEFQQDKSELMFVITPRLVKPLAEAPALPTDGFRPPSRAEFFLEGRMESGAPAPDASGFQLK